MQNARKGFCHHVAEDRSVERWEGNTREILKKAQRAPKTPKGAPSAHALDLQTGHSEGSEPQQGFAGVARLMGTDDSFYPLHEVNTHGWREERFMQRINADNFPSDIN